MRKEELCASLAKIQPSEELICSTINKINEQRLGLKKRRSMTTPMFASRLASAVCALLVVIGAAFYVQPSLSLQSEPIDSSSRSGMDGSPYSEDITPLDSHSMDASLLLSSIARLEYSDWAVVEASVDMCLFAPADEGALYTCILQLGAVRVADSDSSHSFEEGAPISATVSIYDEETANRLFSLSDENVSFLLTAGEDTWQIEDFIIHE